MAYRGEIWVDSDGRVYRPQWLILTVGAPPRGGSNGNGNPGLTSGATFWYRPGRYLTD